MSWLSKIFGIDVDTRRTVSGSKRRSGYAIEEPDRRDFNEVLFKQSFDHIINTQAQVSSNNGTIYWNSANTEFRDKNETPVTLSDGDRILWAGLDTITSNIDISAIDELEHTTDTGVTIAFGSYSLSLGENQRGELRYTGTATYISGTMQLIKTDRIFEDFEPKDLIINVQSNTTVDADAKSITFKNVSTTPAIIYDINETFDITTDLMSGTSEKSSTWYQMWIDSELNRLLVPDLTGTTDSTTTGKLEDSTADFVTDKVQIGDIVYKTSGIESTTVTAVDDLNTLSLADDYFISGDDYKIRLMSPIGLGEYKARIGAAYNNSSSNFDDSIYSKAPPIRDYIGSETSERDFIVSGTPVILSLKRAVCSAYQIFDAFGHATWWIKGSVTYTVGSGTRTSAFVQISGTTHKNVTSFSQAPTAYPNTGTTQKVEAPAGGSTILLTHSSATTTFYVYFFDLEQEKKPTFAL